MIQKKYISMHVHKLNHVANYNLLFNKFVTVIQPYVVAATLQVALVDLTTIYLVILTKSFWNY